MRQIPAETVEWFRVACSSGELSRTALARADDADNARDHPPVTDPGHAARSIGQKRPNSGEKVWIRA